MSKLTKEKLDKAKDVIEKANKRAAAMSKGNSGSGMA